MYYSLKKNLQKHSKQQSHLETARKKAQKALGKHSAVVETEGTVQNFQLAIAKGSGRISFLSVFICFLENL